MSCDLVCGAVSYAQLHTMLGNISITMVAITMIFLSFFFFFFCFHIPFLVYTMKYHSIFPGLCIVGLTQVAVHVAWDVTEYHTHHILWRSPSGSVVFHTQDQYTFTPRFVWWPHMLTWWSVHRCFRRIRLAILEDTCFGHQQYMLHYNCLYIATVCVNENTAVRKYTSKHRPV